MPEQIPLEEIGLHHLPHVGNNAETIFQPREIVQGITPVFVEAENVCYNETFIEADYKYDTSFVEECNATYKIIPKTTKYTFRTVRKVPKLGVMLVGWGGNNGTTVTGALLANRMQMKWPTKTGEQEANYYGSLTQCSTTSIGRNASGQEVFVPLKDLLPMVHPNDIVLDGWDISSMNLGDAMKRAQVFDVALQSLLYEHLAQLKPRPSIFDLNFVAPNQEDRGDNCISGTKQEKIDQIRRDIREFKSSSGVDKVILLWTANTERFCAVESGLNDSWECLKASIKEDKPEISPSTLFAVASILEGCAYINGSPQNTFVPGVIDLAEQKGVFLGGDDFKSGQTKVKSVLVDFLISAGIKPRSIVSYNHLGNNDGKNLSYPLTFRSKEVSKSSVVDDMVQSNPILYKPDEKPDHCIVIKYIPYVGDSKRAMDEYISEIMMGGKNTIAIHSTCEDSLLASPLILDLVILTELCQRITFRVEDKLDYQHMHSLLSILSILVKAPAVPPGTSVVNAFFKQRACVENILRACLGLQPESNMMLEYKHGRYEHVKSVDHFIIPVIGA